MVLLLSSKIGINSVSALIEKVGYNNVVGKLEYIRSIAECAYPDGSRTILNHINKLEIDHKITTKKKFLN